MYKYMRKHQRLYEPKVLQSVLKLVTFILQFAQLSFMKALRIVAYQRNKINYIARKMLQCYALEFVLKFYFGT